MDDQHTHIDIFEELIRVLELKRQSLGENMGNVVLSADYVYSPGKEKSEQLIRELIAYQKKIKPRRRFRTYFFAVLIPGLLLLSTFLYLNDHRPNRKQNEQPSLDQAQSLPRRKDSVNTGSDITVKYIPPVRTRHAVFHKPKRSERDTVRIEIPDTVHKTIYQTGAAVKKVIIADTNKANPSAANVNHGYYCSLPGKYKFSFEKGSSAVSDQNDQDIKEIAEKILNCRNLNKVEITGYYSQRFLFFNNKKLVNERINEVKKEIKKHQVPSRTLRANSEEKLIKCDKSDSLDLSHIVEIILSE